MPTYQYQAVDSQGSKKKGFIEAESQTRALSILQGKGMMPLRLAPVSSSGGGSIAKNFSLKRLMPAGKVRLSESFYYLGMLLQSGTSLAQSLDMLGRMSAGKAGSIWLDIRDAVESGEKFSDALKKHPRSFPSVYVGMIKVAESVGRLGPVLEQVAKYEEERAEVSGKLLTAMAYPAVITVVGFGAVYFMLANVLPNISRVFEASKKELPMSTKTLLALGDFFHSVGILGLLPPILLVVGAIMAYKKVPRVKTAVDRFLWKIPLVQRSLLARFSGLLGFQLESGIPLVQGLESAAAAISSSFFYDHVMAAKEEVSTGRPLDKVFAEQGIFPELYIMTISTGQKAGQLGEFMQRIARVLEKEVDNTLKRLVALAEPLLLLFVGVMIGFIVLAIMGPIMNLSTLVK